MMGGDDKNKKINQWLDQMNSIEAQLCKASPVFTHYLNQCSMCFDGKTLWLRFKHSFTRALVAKRVNRQLISDVCKNVVGREVVVRLPDYCDWDMDEELKTLCDGGSND